MLPRDLSTTATDSELLSGDRPSRGADASEWTDGLDAAHRLASSFLTTLRSGPVSQHAGPAEMASRFSMPFPRTGCPAEEAVQEWFTLAEPGIVRSTGPRYFGFVTGGATPAAVAGDWLASAIDQNAGTWLMSPAAMQTELTVIRWLLELFRLPSSWSGAMTSGATMANLCGLAAGRQWLSEQLGFDAASDGLGGHPPLRVISSTEIHQSALKALAILGLGREAIVKVPAKDGVVDLEAFQAVLDDSETPVLVVANAGEVNTGAFDPIRDLAQRCSRHRQGAWLHVDGAFGLYSALSPQHRELLDGIDQADSVASDAHKWLNVPYDCGFVFVRETDVWRRAFNATAAYLNLDGQPAVWNALDYVPEMSRRFRALAAWCALRAAGRAGFEAIVARSIANAEQFAAWVSQAPELELAAPVHLNIVCFRIRENAASGDTDVLTARLSENIQRGGKAFVSFTRWQDRAAIRAAFDNWSTTAADVEVLQDAVRSALAVTLAGTATAV